MHLWLTGDDLNGKIVWTRARDRAAEILGLVDYVKIGKLDAEVVFLIKYVGRLGIIIENINNKLILSEKNVLKSSREWFLNEINSCKLFLSKILEVEFIEVSNESSRRFSIFSDVFWNEW